VTILGLETSYDLCYNIKSVGDIMERDYKFKDLSALSEEDKRNEILNYFDGINVPYNKINVAEFIYNYSKNIGRNLYYQIAQIVINYFQEDDLSPKNIKLLENIYQNTRKMYIVKDSHDYIYYKLFEFCKDNNLYGKFDAKQLIFGLKYLYMYCYHDSKRLVYDAKTINKILNGVTNDKDAKVLISNANHFDLIQDTFRYLLIEKYPNNQKDIVKTIFNCFKGVKQHQKLHFENLDENDPVKSINITTMDALYSMAYIYEKLIQNISEKDVLDEGEERFADTFISEVAEVYAQHPRALFNKKMVYNFAELLKFLKSENLSEEERFTEEELKEFLLGNVRSVLGVDTNIEAMKEKYSIVKELIDYANIDASEKVSIKKLLTAHNSMMIHSHVDSVGEHTKLLLGKTLNEAYGEDKDPLSEYEYRYYLKILEMKELFGDVSIQNITPEGLNKLIREDPIALNNVRCSVIQMQLNKIIDCLFDAFDLDDGDIYYTNEKIDMLNNILGIDVKTLITLDNIPYLCNNKAVINMRKDDSDIMWFNFGQNIKLLKQYYMPSDIVNIIKYHPDVIFSDYNTIKRFLEENDVSKLFNGLEINRDFYNY